MNVIMIFPLDGGKPGVKCWIRGLDFFDANALRKHFI